MRFNKYLEEEYKPQYGGPIVESLAQWQNLILGVATLGGLLLSAERTYEYFVMLSGSWYGGVFGVSAIEGFIIGFGASMANRYRTKTARWFQFVGGFALAVVSVLIIVGTNTHATLSQFGDAPGAGFDRTMALALGIAAPLLAFFGVKEIVYLSRNIRQRNQAHLAKYLEGARQQFAIDYPKAPAVPLSRTETPAPKRKRNPHAKRDAENKWREWGYDKAALEGKKAQVLHDELKSAGGSDIVFVDEGSQVARD